jgi:hypothetical protein
MAVMTVMLGLHASTTQASAQATTVKEGARAARLLEWAALGSGCRSRPSPTEPVNVTLHKSSTVDADGKTTYRFSLSRFELDGAKPISAAEPAFARDCAMRLVVEPPTGMRIRSLAAETRLRLNKSEGFSFQIAGSISTPRAQIGLTTFTFSPEQRLTDSDLLLRVVPEQGGTAGDIDSACGEARVLGVDLVLSTNRARFSQTARAILAGERQVQLDVFFEACRARMTKDRTL